MRKRIVFLSVKLTTSPIISSELAKQFVLHRLWSIGGLQYNKPDFIQNHLLNVQRETVVHLWVRM